MIVSKFEGIIFLSIWLAAIGFFFAGAYFHLRLLSHIRPKNWWASSWWLNLWVYSKVSKYVSPEGMPYLRRFRQSFIGFLGIILIGFLYVGILYITR